MPDFLDDGIYHEVDGEQSGEIHPHQDEERGKLDDSRNRFAESVDLFIHPEVEIPVDNLDMLLELKVKKLGIHFGDILVVFKDIPQSVDISKSDLVKVKKWFIKTPSTTIIDIKDQLEKKKKSYLLGTIGYDYGLVLCILLVEKALKDIKNNEGIHSDELAETYLELISDDKTREILSPIFTGQAEEIKDISIKQLAKVQKFLMHFGEENTKSLITKVIKRERTEGGKLYETFSSNYENDETINLGYIQIAVVLIEEVQEIMREESTQIYGKEEDMEDWYPDEDENAIHVDEEYEIPHFSEDLERDE